MISCAEVQAALDASGVQQVDDTPHLRKHIDQCEACSAYRYASLTLDVQLASLKEHAAPKKLLQQVINSCDQSAKSKPKFKPKPKPKPNRKWLFPLGPFSKTAYAAAAAFAIVVFLIVPTVMYKPSTDMYSLGTGASDGQTVDLSGETLAGLDSRQNSPLPAGAEEIDKESRLKAEKNQYARESTVLEQRFSEDKALKKFKAKPKPKKLLSNTLESTSTADATDALSQKGAEFYREEADEVMAESKPVLANRSTALNSKQDFGQADSGKDSSAPLQLLSPPPQSAMVAEEEMQLHDDFNAESGRRRQVAGLVMRDPIKNEQQRFQKSVKKPAKSRLYGEKRNQRPERANSAERDKAIDAPEQIARLEMADQSKRGLLAEPEEIMLPETMEFSDISAPIRQKAQQFFSELQSLKNIRYQSAQGYWRNTYIPGDPAMRLLHKRLNAWDRQQAQQLLRSNITMDQLAHQYMQPFDPPSRSALAVYLHSDHAAINDEPTRLRLQVGIQASERLSGHRSALNIGIILDLKDSVGKDQWNQIRAFIDTLKSLKQPGDHFSITVTGKHGGLWVDSNNFRHGPIHLAFEKLRSRHQLPDSEKTKGAPQYLSLKDAISQTSESMRLHDDPSSTLGSSRILLISNNQQWDNLHRLEQQVHQNAVAGITLSVVALNRDFEQVDKLVLAGQGNRWLVNNLETAKQAAQKELLSSSRAVARAVRLKIRLAKNVKLIRVIDSEKLSSQRAQRVREAEQSIDQRLSRNLGITADRGKDDDGIQIVIPHFYAGDSHVILLDVVASGPGDIADVSVKYKDLLYMRNGNAQAQLRLKQGHTARGPMQYKVIKNLLASRLSAAIKQARSQVSLGQLSLATEELRQLRELYEELRLQVSSWHNDPEILADIQLLDQFIVVLNSPLYSDNHQRRFVLDALEYSGWRKTVSQHE
ncbi:MAG: hypothetical protein OEZ68_06490 [Gammaproteobacteria bacterium]|nr:hypothetical protein [Gammaproteobacteria bacterium]MDH5800438.1 hypothetical protein [Gammaproteobacteria bacterium]